MPKHKDPPPSIPDDNVVVVDLLGQASCRPATRLPTPPPPPNFGSPPGASSDFTGTEHLPTMLPAHWCKDTVPGGKKRIKTLYLTNQDTGARTIIHVPPGLLADKRDVEAQVHRVYSSNPYHNQTLGVPANGTTFDDDSGVLTLSYINKWGSASRWRCHLRPTTRART